MINGYHSIADINAIAYVKLKDHLPSRSMWRGSVSFGLVNTPVKVYIWLLKKENFLLINYVQMVTEFSIKNGAQ